MLSIPGGLGPFNVAQAGLELLILLPLPCGITEVYFYARWMDITVLEVSSVFQHFLFPSGGSGNDQTASHS